MINIVYLTEKVSAAAAVASALGIDTSNRNADGFFEGIFAGKRNVVVYTNGHIFELKEPEALDARYKVWSLEDLPIRYGMALDDLVAKDDKRILYIKIKNELKNADLIINAGDAGREGELIQRRLIDKAAVKATVYRLWTQSLTKEAVMKAKDDLYIVRTALDMYTDRQRKKKEVFDNLYAAGRVRAYMDALMGFNYSRAVSLARTQSITVAYGRCQSPLVNMIIERDKEIETFVPAPFAYVEAMISSFGKSFTATLTDREGKRLEFNDENKAREYIKGLSDKGGISSTGATRKTEHPDKPFDILTLQKEMARLYDFTADHTLSLCQRLYEDYHILSYPRTDSRYYTTDLKKECSRVLTALSLSGVYDDMEDLQIGEIPARYFNDKKVADHHAFMPVIPEGGLERAYAELTGDEKKVFRAVAENFLSLFLPDHVYDALQITVTSGEYMFCAHGKREVEKGYTILREEDREDKKEPALPPDLAEGERVSIEPEVILSERKPKQHYTTESLLNLMKVYNIGTGATRDTIIKELITPKGSNSKASVVKEGRYYISTDFGRLINDLIPDKIKSIEFLAGLESALKKIEEGRLGEEAFLKSLDAEIESNISEIIRDRDKVPRISYYDTGLAHKCPVCGAPLVSYREFYGCSRYNDPKPCRFTVSKQIRGKKLSDKTIAELLTRGRSRKLKFLSKDGREYSACVTLSLDGGKGRLSVEL